MFLALGLPWAAVAAQTSGWDLSVVLSPTLPARVDVLAKQPGYLSVVVTYTGARLAQFEVRSRLSSSAGLSASASSVPRNATGPGTHLFTNATRALVDDPTLRLPPEWATLAQRGGVLPADRYRFCAAVYVDDRPVTAERCATTIVELPQPPQLLMPADGASVETSSPVFVWTPVTQIDAATSVRYRLRVAELPAGRLPGEALGSLAWHEAEIDRRTQYVYPASALPLKDGMSYVWQVTAYDADGAPFGAGGGRSLMQRFTYRDPAAALALGEVEVVPGRATIPSLRGTTVVGGDPARLIVSGPVPLRITLPGGDARTLSAVVRDLVISRGPGAPRVIGGELDVTTSWPLGAGATIERMRLGRNGMLETAGTLRVGGVVLRAIGSLGAGASVLDARTSGVLPLRLGTDTLAVIVRAAHVTTAGNAPDVTADVEAFGAPTCRPGVLEVSDSAAVVELSCTAKADTARGPMVTGLRGRFRAVAARLSDADVAVELSVPVPFAPTRGVVRLNGKLSGATGLRMATVQLPRAEPVIRMGALRFGVRAVSSPRAGWTRSDGWRVRVNTLADISVPGLAIAMRAVDSLVLTGTALELPALERDAAVFSAPSFTGGDVRVRPRVVRWPASRLSFSDSGASWRGEISGVAGVAHVASCVQALSVPATRGVFGTARVDWPLDTLAVRGACSVRKPDGSLVSVEAVAGLLSGAFGGDSTTWTGRASFVERVVTVAAAQPADTTAPNESANIPATLRVPGGTLSLRDAAGRPLVAVRRRDARTLEFTPRGGAALPFEALGGLAGAATFTRLIYDSQSGRLAGGAATIVYAAADPRRMTLLAAIPAEVDSLVVVGDPVAPRASLHAAVRLFGRRLGVPVLLAVDEMGVATGNIDAALGAPAAFDVAAGGAVQLRVTRVRGLVRLPLDGGAVQRDLTIDADLAAPGIVRSFALRVPGAEGPLVVIGAQGARAARVAGPVRLDSLQLSTLSWSAAAGFQLSAVAEGAARAAVRGGAAFDVPLRGMQLTERDLRIAAARVISFAPAVMLAEGVAARVTRWSVPAWTASWARWSSAVAPEIGADASLQFDRMAALRSQWFTAQLTLRADSTVCGTATARPLAQPVVHRQGGVGLRITDVAPVLPACEARGAAIGATISASVQASLLRPAALQSAAEAWPLPTALTLDAASGTLRGVQTINLAATARDGALELQLASGQVSVADSVTWSGTANGRLVPSQAAPTPNGTGQVAFNLGAGRVASGRIEITQSFAWRVPSGAGVLSVQVPRAVLSATGATFVGEGTVDATALRIAFDSLRLDATALAIIGGRARVLGTLPLALDASGGWRVAAAGSVTLPLVDPVLDATGLAAASAAPSSLNALGVAVASLDTRLTAGFRFGVDPGSVTTGRADLHEGSAADAPRRAWLDSLGLHVEGAMPTLPDSVALPSFDVAYARLRVNGQLLPSSLVGGAITIDASVTPVEVVLPSLGGLSVPMLGSISIDGLGRVSAGSLTASLGNAPTDLAFTGLPLQLRGLDFGPSNGALAMRASISARALPGLGDFALPNAELALGADGLSGLLATGSCAGNAAPVAERNYANGALTLRLLGYEANLSQRTLCARLDAVAQLGGAGAPATTIPVSATWSVGSGRWTMTAAAQGLPEVTIGVAVLTPDAQQGITVVAQDPGTFALQMRGAVSFPQALGDGVAVAIDTLRIATDGVRIAANSRTPQRVTLFDGLLSLTTSGIQADYADDVLELVINGDLSMLGRSDLGLTGLTLRSDGTVSGGAVQFGRAINVLAGRLSIASLGFTATGGRLGVDLGGQLTLPAPFGRSAPFAIQVRGAAAGWTAEMQAPSIAFGTGFAIGDNADTEIAFGAVATFDLLSLGVTLDLRSPSSARISAAAALYLMNDVGRRITFGNPANASGEPGLRIDANGVAWNATLPDNVPSLDLGLFAYTLTGFGGVGTGNRFGFEFAGTAALNVPGVEGTLSLTGLALGLDGATPGALGNGPHNLTLMGGIVSLSIGSMASGSNGALTLTGAGAGASAATSTVQAVEWVRLTDATMSIGEGFFTGGVREVVVYRLADGTRSIGIMDAALSLAGVTTLNASMRYINGPDGFRLSAGGSAMIAGGTGFGAAGFFSNRNGTLGAGIFVAANANIPLLPPLISLSGIGGGLFINPTGEDVQMVLSVVEGMGLRMVGDPPPLPGPNERMGFAAFLYGGAGLIGAGGGYAIEGKAFLQVTTAYVRIDARGVLLGQTDRLTAGVMLQVQYGNGWSVMGAGEADIDFPGVDGHASMDFLLANEGGNFTWAIQAAASLDVVAFSANGAFFASQDGFYAEVGIGSGFSYGPVEISAEVVVGVFLDASRGKVGAFGIVSAEVDLEIASAEATLKGALVLTRNSAYLGFGGRGRACVADLCASAAVHASFDNGDFDAGLGRDKKLDRIIDDMRNTARRIERSATDAAASLAAEVESNWWRVDEQTLSNAGFALLTLPDEQRTSILAPVLAAEARTQLSAAYDVGTGRTGLSPSELRRWVLDSVLADPARPRPSDADAAGLLFGMVAASTATNASGVLGRVRIVIDSTPASDLPDLPGGSPLTVRVDSARLHLSLDADAYDAVERRARRPVGAGSSLASAQAAVQQAEGALDSLDAVFHSAAGGRSSVASVGEGYADSHKLLEQWQARRLAVATRAGDWGNGRLARLQFFSSGATNKYRFGWSSTLRDGGGSYRLLAAAAVARRQALLDLAAHSASLAAPAPLADAASFAAQLFALDTIPGRDEAFLAAVAGTWGELWIDAPRRGLLAASDSAMAAARALLPSLATQRAALAQRHQVFSSAVEALYLGRLDLTAQVAALYDEARLIEGAPVEWTQRRDVLMADLEPPTLGAPQVHTVADSGVVASTVSWTATHPNGLGGSDLDASRDGGATPRFVGSRLQLVVATAREGDADSQRRYNVAARVRSRAGASVMRAAVFDVDLPRTARGEAMASTPDVTAAADNPPVAPTVVYPYRFVEPIPLAPVTDGVSNPNLNRVAGGVPGRGLPSLDVSPLLASGANAPPPAAESRVYFSGDLAAIDVDVSRLNLNDLAALEVAIGTDPSGEQVRAFAPAPAAPTGTGRRVMLRGLSLQRDVDYWVRVRARDAAGQRSAASGVARPLRIDDRFPPPPTLRRLDRIDSGTVVRIAYQQHAPSGLQNAEYVVSRLADAAAAFSLATAIQTASDSILLRHADLVPGGSVWLHIRSVSKARVTGPARSIEVATPAALAGLEGLPNPIAAPPFAPLAPGANNQPAAPVGRPRLP